MRFRIIVQGMPLFTYLKGMPLFLKEYGEIRRQAGVSGKSFPFGKLYPCLQEKDQESGVLAEHYFYQDLYVARKVFQNNPVRHVDIGSRIDGFVAHVASFREIEVLDVRDLHLGLPSIRFTRADLSAKDFPLTDYCDSLSCLHALEHFGLGRYGDPLDSFGSEKAFKELIRVLSPGGSLYLSVPVDKENKVYFNAHRAFTRDYVLELLCELKLEEEKYIYGNTVYDAYDPQKGFGTGLYYFKKI